jgi:hypothetical protein
MFRSRLERAKPDETIAKILDEPAEREGALLDAVRKAGGDEGVLLAAAAYSRVSEALREAFGTDGIPDLVAKAMSDQSAKDDDEKSISKSAEERERVADRARRTNERIQRCATRAELEKAEEDRCEGMSAGERADEALRILKDVEVLSDRQADKLIDDAAKRIRKRDPSLTEAQAFVKALDEDPTLYEASRRHQLRAQGALTDEDTSDADAKLDAAAAELRKADPALTEPQAIAKALENDPSLYA